MKTSIWKYIIILFLIVWTIWTILFFILTDKNRDPHYDWREEWCRWKSISSVEFNIDEQKCFETQISACQKPTFTSIDECKKLNGVK